ncbi:MAG: twin-arginine translocase TatA/TatE family subunit [candidate division Zixibacteria bacterium]|nr:twin-arginine translocase TatA/TatE family subunit [candidate division Zixibacteria bacterium]
MLWMPGPTELLLIFLAVLLLFGAKRIPEIAQGLGRGIRDFKKSMKETQDEISNLDDSSEKGKSELEDNSKDKK